jgi:hypothetical protein
MREPVIWSNVTANNMPVVVLKDDVLYGGAVQTHQFAKFKNAIEDGVPPAELLGTDCQQAALEDVTRVVANSTGDLIIEVDGKPALKLAMQKAGVRIVETIEDRKGHPWEARVERKARIGSAILSVVLGVVFGAAMVWAYYGIVNGQINRIHWLAAILVNSLGPWVLLLIGALVFLGGMFGFGYYLAHPAEIWTLEED